MRKPLQWISAVSGAAFLMATSAIGPGFINNTSLFTRDLGASFGFVILAALLLDIVIQLCVWLPIGLKGRYAQQIAQEVLPGSGHALSVMIALGGLVFNIGNLAGCVLGLQILFGLPVPVALLISVAVALPVLLAGRAGRALDLFSFFLGLVMILLMLTILVRLEVPVAAAVAGTFRPERIDLPVLLTVIGGTVGGYISFAGAHHLVDAGIADPDRIRRGAVRGIVITTLMRYLLFLAALSAVWAGDALLLARRVQPATEATAVEGAVLDWPRLQADLVATIADLLPGATLEPANDTTPTTDQRLLAAIPARLVPGPVPPPVVAGWSPLRGTLAVAWAAMAVAAAAVGALLASVLALSERRAAFVSSVTHELRTPLTTFRLYSGLLEEGMVAAAEVPTYHATLRREADRLTHLVENVLAYARLERGRHAARLAPVSVGDLLAHVTPRPAERATQAGFDWQIEADDATRRLTVTTDPAAVEQVLFNLVDNACKYARAAEPALIAVTATPRGRSLAIAVRDHGPGVTAREAARLFEPFRKSARDAAEGAAGVGLGLALSRRLARQMGGDLASEPPTDGGSRFVLTLPLNPPAGRCRRF